MKDRWPDAFKVISKLEDAGFEAYVVGGAVRDFVRGVQANDVDITTNALPHEVKTLFEHTIDVGIEHGTVLVVLEDPIEVTTYRSETSYSDFRRPDEVRFVRTLREDLQRRDFTINAMALTKEDELIDFFGGKQDLKLKIIKAVGNPKERFSEDALRMLRAIRFSSQLNFSLEQSTLDALQELHPLITHISMERVKVELEKIWVSNYPYRGMELFAATGLSEHFLGDWCTNVSLWKQFNHFGNRANGWAFFVLMNEGLNIGELLSNFKCSNDEKSYVKNVLLAVKFLKKGFWTSYELFQFTVEVLIAAASYSQIIQHIEHPYTPDILADLKAKLAISSVREIVVSGHDLMEWKKEKRGPWIREVLDRLTTMILNEEIENDRQHIKEWFIREYVN